MEQNGVCAVLVTFRPVHQFENNLAKIRAQVQDMVVVDNGSSNETLVWLRDLSERLSFTFVQNQKNLGIAAALNIGVQWAQSARCKLIVFFDQDSLITEGYICAMLAEYKSHPMQRGIALLMPRYISPLTGKWEEPECLKDGNPVDAMTSGSLVPMSVFASCGLFEEDLIIDCVDTEFCLRAGRLGLFLVLCRNATLLHAAGTPRIHSLLGLRTVTATHHNAARRYYMTRNNLVIIGRYWRYYPYWCFRCLDSMLRQTLKIVLVEENRWVKIANIAHGVLDALRGRMGWVIDLK